jgi:hypothetical protein
VKSLPRSALVEKQVQLHTGRVLQIDDDDDEPSWVMRTPYTIRGQLVVIYMKKHHSEYDNQEIPSKALNVYRGKLVD